MRFDKSYIDDIMICAKKYELDKKREEEGTDINIFFETAVNTAHKGLEIEYTAELKTVHECNALLTKIGKNVKLSMS